MTPQSRGKTAKTAVFRHRWQAWQVVRSIAAVRQRPRTPRNWRCSFTFFESFLWHFNEKQRGEVIFRHSRPVSCKNQENGAGKQWSVHAPLKARHEAVSFEAAEWSERLTSGRVGWLGAAAVGSIPALVTFFSFSSLLLLLFLSSLSKPIFLLFTRNYFYLGAFQLPFSFV